MIRRVENTHAIEALVIVAVGLGVLLTTANSTWAIGGLTCVSDKDPFHHSQPDRNWRMRRLHSPSRCNIGGGTMQFFVPPTQTVPDGFLLQGTCSGDADCQTIVFVASPGSASDFGVAAAGFKITSTNEVFATDGFSPSDCFNNTPTRTPTFTPTRTPTSCRGDLPVVEPVTSPTGLLQQVIRFCGRIVGASSMSVSSEAGPAPQPGFGSGCSLPCPNPGNASCNQTTVTLLANQANHIVVCQNNAFCSGGCVSVDGNGQPLTIIQLLPTAPTLSPTATPTQTPPPTPTPPPGTCIGDCNGDGEVTIDELILGVNIALGSADFGACPAFDCHSDCHPGPSATPIPSVNVACLIRAVNNTLYACPPPACTTDADCDDGNACTTDLCTIDGCTHGCVCD